MKLDINKDLHEDDR